MTTTSTTVQTTFTPNEDPAEPGTWAFSQPPIFSVDFGDGLDLTFHLTDGTPSEWLFHSLSMDQGGGDFVTTTSGSNGEQCFDWGSVEVKGIHSHSIEVVVTNDNTTSTPVTLGLVLTLENTTSTTTEENQRQESPDPQITLEVQPGTQEDQESRTGSGARRARNAA